MATGDDVGNGNGHSDHIEVSTPMGKIAAWGRDVIIIIVIAGLAIMTLYEHNRREKEHDEIICLLGLDLWIHDDRVSNHDFSQVPRQFWKCLPESIFATKADH